MLFKRKKNKRIKRLPIPKCLRCGYCCSTGHCSVAREEAEERGIPYDEDEKCPFFIDDGIGETSCIIMIENPEHARLRITLGKGCALSEMAIKMRMSFGASPLFTHDFEHYRVRRGLPPV